MKPMRVQASRSAFAKVLEARKTELSDLIPGTGFALMCAFYATRRAERCDIEQDGDMLLFQWGVGGAGSAERFTLEITRQFMWGSGESAEIRHLSLSFTYAATPELRAIGAGNGWCQSPVELEEFVTFVTTSRAYQLLEQVEAPKVSLNYHKA